MNRRTAIVLITLLTALPGVGWAADIALKAPPQQAAVPFSWTGCFIGGHAGGLVSEDRTANDLGNSQAFSSAGFVGGGQAGCDYQFASRWVAGIEGRAAYSSLSNSHNTGVRNLITGVVLPARFTLSNDFLASVTARLGYSVADRWLVFVRGGAAWTREKADDAFTLLTGRAVDPATTTTRIGWTAGIGADWAFASHWSASLQYDYTAFPDHALTLAEPGGTTVTIFHVNDRLHAVTAGVDYHL